MVDLEVLNHKNIPCWVLGGNHSYEAVMKVCEQCPDKHFIDKVLVQIYWFTSLSDPGTMESIDYLAAHHNVDQEFRKQWDFIDCLNFLCCKYVRPDHQWKAETQEQACHALGFATVKTMNPLLQLVVGSKQKWEALKRVLNGAKEKIGSEAKFQCLQGELSEESVINILESVADGKITLEQMQNQATELKLDARIKSATAQLLNCKTFEEVQKKYGTAAFNEHKHQSFYTAFACLKQGKGKCNGKERNHCCSRELCQICGVSETNGS